MKNPIARFGICLHRWGKWYHYDGSRYRLAATDERASRVCEVCNTAQVR